MDFDQLALETLNLKSPFQGKNPFDVHQFSEVPPVLEDFWREDEQLPKETESLQGWLYPAGPGVLFVLDRNGPTFCLRGSAVDKIKEEYEQLKNPTTEHFERFRLSAEGLETPLQDRVFFFETEDRELAEVIVDQLFNRRFAVEEDMLCNLSDPGFSWWLCLKEQSFDLYFRSHGVNRAQELINLGPMGDRAIGSLRLNKLLMAARAGLGAHQIKASEKQLSFRVEDPKAPAFLEWRDFFVKGHSPERLLEQLAGESDLTLYYYTRELAALRLFWLEIESHLSH